MIEHVSQLISQVRNYAKQLLPQAKRIWSGYGYYISLACLLALFGIAAYVYRTGNNAAVYTADTGMNYAEAMARISVTPAPTPAPTPWSPSFILPANGEIISDFSANELIWNETLGQWIVHNGIDIRTSAGTVVCASENGVISAAYEDDLFGNTIEITHDGGWISRYCSLETLQLAEIGKKVYKGDAISSAGTSALCEASSGSHVHFELLKNGEYMKPEFE